MTSYRPLFIFLNILLIIPSLMFLGDLTDDLGDYRPYTETFQGFRTNRIINRVGMPNSKVSDSKMRTSRQNNNDEAYLILQTEEGSEWFIGEDQYENWKILANENNKGKQIKFYNRGDQYFYIDPVRVELDGRVIFDNTKIPLWKYLVLGLTFVLTIYNFRSERKGD